MFLVPVKNLLPCCIFPEPTFSDCTCSMMTSKDMRGKDLHWKPSPLPHRHIKHQQKWCTWYQYVYGRITPSSISYTPYHVPIFTTKYDYLDFKGFEYNQKGENVHLQHWTMHCSMLLDLALSHPYWNYVVAKRTRSSNRETVCHVSCGQLDSAVDIVGFFWTKVDIYIYNLTHTGLAFDSRALSQGT